MPGTTEPVRSAADARDAAEALGYPVAVKAAAGGGGLGFRVAHSEDELEKAFSGASAEGERFFRSAEVYLERYFADPRHVEIQVLGDGAGTVVQLGERDCSIQRRHQKLVEEAPGPTVDAALRERLAGHARSIARHIGYTSAGTVEGLLVDGQFYFLEMNTRLQVEHPVTELATGVDIVHEQLRIAAGLPLSVAQEQIALDGVAIECRVNAESAHKGFAPSPGTIGRYDEPAGVRIDSGCAKARPCRPSTTHCSRR